MSSVTQQQVPEGYNNTDVGVVPSDWEVLDIQSFSKTGSGTTPARAQKDRYFKNGETYWVKTTDLNNSVIRKTEDKVTDLALKETCLQVYPVGTVLVAMYGGFNQIGRTGILSIPAAVNQALVAVQVNKKTDSRYLLNMLNYKVEYWKSVASSSRKDPNITSADVKNFKLALPPEKEEQTAIANALSDVDALITSLEKLITKKRAIKSAAMQQLLTGKKRLPPFDRTETGKVKPLIKSKFGLIPEDWSIKLLKTISTMHGRIGWQGLKQEEFTFNDRQPFLITGMNFKDGKIRWNEVYHIAEDRYELDRNIQLREGDILMTKDGTIGKLLFVDEIPAPHKASLNSHLLVFRPVLNAYEPKYLYYLMKTEMFSDHIDLHKSGSTFFGITQEAVGKFDCLLPSKKEQEAISVVLSEMDDDIESLEIRLNKTLQLKQGMMQELLTGRTRLV